MHFIDHVPSPRESARRGAARSGRVRVMHTPPPRSTELLPPPSPPPPIGQAITQGWLRSGRKVHGVYSRERSGIGPRIISDQHDRCVREGGAGTSPCIEAERGWRGWDSRIRMIAVRQAFIGDFNRISDSREFFYRGVPTVKPGLPVGRQSA